MKERKSALVDVFMVCCDVERDNANEDLARSRDWRRGCDDLNRFIGSGKIGSLMRRCGSGHS